MWGWMPFIWKTVPSKIHTNGALRDGKIVGPFPTWGPLSTRRQKEPMSSVCNFFNPAKDRAVRHTRRPCPEDTQQAVALTQMPSPSCSSKHLPWICKQKQPALKGLSGEGKYGCDRRIPLGHCWAKRWALKSQEEEALAPHAGSCRAAGQQDEREATLGGPRPALRVTAKSLVEFGLRGLASRHGSWILSFWAEQRWLQHLFGSALPPDRQPLPYSWLSCCLLGRPSDWPTTPS